MRRHCCKPKPCNGPDYPGGCGGVETVVEPTVHCRMPARNSYKRIRHIVPVVYHQRHNHHDYHEYEIRRQYKSEDRYYEHNRRRPGGLCGGYDGCGDGGGFVPLDGADGCHNHDHDCGCAE